MNNTEALQIIKNLRPAFVTNAIGEAISPIANSTTVYHNEETLNTVLQNINEALSILNAIGANIRNIEANIQSSEWVNKGDYYEYKYIDESLKQTDMVELSTTSKNMSAMAAVKHRWMIADLECHDGYIYIYSSNKPSFDIDITLSVTAKTTTIPVTVTENSWQTVNYGELYKYTYSNQYIKNNTMVYCALDLENIINFSSEGIDGGMISTENTEDGKVDIYCDIKFSGTINLILYNVYTTIPYLPTN